MSLRHGNTSRNERRGGRRRLLAVALSSCVALLAFAAPGAFAADICVNSPQCGGNSLTSLQAALNTAQLTHVGDRIFVGPGTYFATDGFTYASPNPLELIGAGRDATKLVSTSQFSKTLTVSNTKVRDLTLQAPQGGVMRGTGLELNASIGENLNITAETGAQLINQGQLKGSNVKAVLSAVETFGGGSISNSTLESASGPAVINFNNNIDISNSSLTGLGGLQSSGDGHVHDTLIRLKGDGNLRSGIAAAAHTGNSSMTATNVTVVGDGRAGEFTAAAVARDTLVARVVLENVIAVGTPKRFYREASNNGTATIVARHSDLPATADEDAGGAGAIEISQDTISINPGFVDPAGDFHLAPTSPLIDRGTPTPADGLGATDLDGSARVADGDGDGSAAPDMGAFERPAPGSRPTPAGGGTLDGGISGATGSTPAAETDLAPVLSRLAVTPRKFVLGTRSARRGGFSYKLSEPARVTIKIQRLRAGRRRTVGRIAQNARRGANRMAFSGRLRRRKLKPGRYLATAVAVDTAGKRSTARRVRFTVTSR
jgi:hypothetical protein